MAKRNPASFVNVIARIPLLFLYVGEQFQNALAFGFIGNLLRQPTEMPHVLAPDETSKTVFPTLS